MFKKFIIFMLLSCSSLSAEFEHELSACMIFRDEAPYLKEWIEYHLLVGVQHFYLCNHNSQDTFREILAPYVERGIVEVEDIYNNPDVMQSEGDFVNNNQIPFYNRAIEKSKGRSRWLAIIDSDEFLVPVETNSLLELLEEYRDCAGIGVNWQMFGTSNCERVQPDELMIEKLTSCAPHDHHENFHIKSIVQPLFVICMGWCPHLVVYHSGYQHVNTDRVEFEGPFSPYIQTNQIRINHYWTRDEDFLWKHKFARQTRWLHSGMEAMQNRVQLYNSSKDTTILHFVPDLKKRMFPEVNP